MKKTVKELDLKLMSINRAWQGRRFRTKEYKEWTEEGLALLNGMEVKAVLGNRIRVEICFVMKNFLMSDIDNGIKTFLDLIVKAHLIRDDRFIEELEVKKEKGEKDYILFRITKIN